MNRGGVEITAAAAQDAYEALAAKPVHGHWLAKMPDGTIGLDPLTACVMHSKGIDPRESTNVASDFVAKQIGVDPNWVTGWAFGWDDYTDGRRVNRGDRSPDALRDGYAAGWAFGEAWAAAPTTEPAEDTVATG